MDRIFKHVTPNNVRILAEATFTADMVSNLAAMFEYLESHEVVTVKFSDKGVWAVSPQGVRLFIGSTEVFEVGIGCDEKASAKIQ